MHQLRLARGTGGKRSKVGDRQVCVKAFKKFEQPQNVISSIHQAIPVACPYSGWAQQA